MSFTIKKIIDINRKVFGEIFQAPQKQRFDFCDSSLFLVKMTFTRNFCDTLHLLRNKSNESYGQTHGLSEIR